MGAKNSAGKKGQNMPLTGLLSEAHNVINGKRLDIHGNPEDSFSRIAAYWELYLGKPINNRDVAIMMTLLKLAREENQHKRDNLRDACGYLAILADRLTPQRMGKK